jgi:hypothetical protein
MATYHEELAGTTRGGRQALVAAMQVGDSVQVVRDGANSYGEHSIDVRTASGDSLGFIKRVRAAELAPLLDLMGGSAPGRVAAKLGGGFEAYGLMVEFTLVDPPPPPKAPIMVVSGPSSPDGRVVIQAQDTYAASPELGKLLSHLIRYDVELRHDAKRLYAFLLDLALAEPRPMIRALVDAASFGISKELEDGGIPATPRARLRAARTLSEVHGMRRDMADEAAETWAVALEFSRQELAEEPEYPWASPIDDEPAADVPAADDSVSSDLESVLRQLQEAREEIIRLRAELEQERAAHAALRAKLAGVPARPQNGDPVTRPENPFPSIADPFFVDSAMFDRLMAHVDFSPIGFSPIQKAAIRMWIKVCTGRIDRANADHGSTHRMGIYVQALIDLRMKFPTSYKVWLDTLPSAELRTYFETHWPAQT